MAAGLSLPEENIEVFRRQLNEKTVLTEEDFCEKVSIDMQMPLRYVTEELVEELELLEPFGKGNTKPVFVEKDMLVLNSRILGKNQNVLKNGDGCDLFWRGTGMSGKNQESRGKNHSDVLSIGQ